MSNHSCQIGKALRKFQPFSNYIKKPSLQILYCTHFGPFSQQHHGDFNTIKGEWIWLFCIFERLYLENDAQSSKLSTPMYQVYQKSMHYSIHLIGGTGRGTGCGGDARQRG